MGEAIDALELLNRLTFEAEARKPIGSGTEQEDWRPFLQRVLAANFSIKRWNGASQNKQEMIEFIEGSKPVERNIEPESIEIHDAFSDKGLAVVSCVVSLAGQTDRFHNTKVFSKQPSGSWICVYWQARRRRS